MRGFSVSLRSELPDYRWETAETIRKELSIPTALQFYLKQL